MTIFADFHHLGLYHSLHLLFEERLGHTLYRPIGMTWWDEGYWKINDIKATAQQYLEIGSIPEDKTIPLNTSYALHEGVHRIPDNHHHSLQKAITFETFQKIPVDIVIASIPQHVAPFKKLAEMKNAKFIFQMGNVFDMNLHDVPNLMANTLPKNIPATTRYISYHQEIDPVFKPSSVSPERLITSFINVYPNNKGYEDYMALKAELPSHEFKSYGGQCYDGTITGVDNMAAIMHKSMFGFHSKHMGDGAGHVLMDWMAVGRPIITRISDYKDKQGGAFLEDMVSCIDLDQHSIEETKDIIQNLKPLHYVMMCQSARDKFDENVDYDAEEIKIKEFLENLR